MKQSLKHQQNQPNELLSDSREKNLNHNEIYSVVIQVFSATKIIFHNFVCFWIKQATEAWYSLVNLGVCRKQYQLVVMSMLTWSVKVWKFRWDQSFQLKTAIGEIRPGSYLVLKDFFSSSNFFVQFRKKYTTAKYLLMEKN